LRRFSKVKGLLIDEKINNTNKSLNKTNNLKIKKPLLKWYYIEFIF